MKRLLSVLVFAAACDQSTGPRESGTTIARTSLAVGSRFGCGLTNTGRAYCWGEGLYGQIGDSTFNQRLEPTAVSGGRIFATIAAGERTVCALDDGGQTYCWGEDPTQVPLNGGTKNTPQRVNSPVAFRSITVGRKFVCGLADGGAAYCWGENGRGQLGVGDTLPHQTPTRVVGGVAFTSIAAGFWHTCGLTADGSAYCWGDNSFGSLGADNLLSASQPQRVAGTSKFSMISPGAAHSCGISKTGETLCWGTNYAGQLGDGTIDRRIVPTPAAPGHSFVKLRAARGNSTHGHTCGVETNGAMYCWGANSKGQLGGGPSTSPCVLSTGAVLDRACSYIPIRVATLTGVMAIDVGQEHTCALTPDGRGFCWGENIHGELGDATGTAQPAPSRIAGTVTFP